MIWPGIYRILEKEMATYSSILAWKIPWMVEPGRLQSMGGKESEMTDWLQFLYRIQGPSRWFNSKESACHCRRCGFDPWLGKNLRVGNGNPLQYSCFKSSMDRGTWWAIVHEAAKTWTQLSTHTHTGCKQQNRKSNWFFTKA